MDPLEMMTHKKTHLLLQSFFHKSYYLTKVIKLRYVCF